MLRLPLAPSLLKLLLLKQPLLLKLLRLPLLKLPRLPLLPTPQWPPRLPLLKLLLLPLLKPLRWPLLKSTKVNVARRARSPRQRSEKSRPSRGGFF